MNMPSWVPWVQLLIEVATLVLVAIYVHKTWQMASSTRAAAEATARATEEATRARIDSMAPRVIAYFEYATHLATIVIENVGHGTACDVSYKFEPPLSGTRPDLVPKFFERTTPILGPGQRLATFFDSWPAYFRADLPRQYKLHLSFVGVENRQRSQPLESMAAIVEAFDRVHPSSVPRLKALPASRWEGDLPFTFQGKEAFRTSADDMAWSFLFDTIHHRGQLSTYLRPMGAKVPQIYGPSADEGSGQ